MSGRKYFGLLFQRIKRIFPTVFVITFILLSLILIFCSAVLNKYNNSSDKQKVKIGLVGNVDGSYMDIGFTAVKNLDASRYTVEFIEMNEDVAKKQTLNGSIVGYIKIPDGLISSVEVGDDVKVEFITKNNTSSFGAYIINEIAHIGSDIVMQTQSAVFTVGDIAVEKGRSDDVELMDNLSVKYILQALNRSNIAEVVNLGISDRLSIGGYYLCGMIILFLMLWGISCCEYLFKNDFTLRKILYSNNIKATKQVACEYIVYFLFTVLMMFMSFSLVTYLSSVMNIGIKEIKNIVFADSAVFLFKCIPVILLFTSIHFILYELFNNRITVITVQIVFILIFGYISGCFYPSYFFPQTLQKIAAVLPVGVGFGYVKQCLGSNLSVETMLLTVLYSVLFFVAVIIIRRYRIVGDAE